MALSHIGRLDGYQYAKGRSAVVLRQRWDANFERFLQNSIGLVFFFPFFPSLRSFGLTPREYLRFRGSSFAVIAKEFRSLPDPPKSLGLRF